MTLYSRPQLRLLLVLAATFLVGLAVQAWRHGLPLQADRLDRFDEAADPPPLPRATARRAPPVAADDGPAGQARRRARPARPAPVASPHGHDSPSPGPAARSRRGGTGSREPEQEPRAAGAKDPRPLDLNRASVEELARLPGVGRGLAERILEERQRRGRFDSADDLRHVLGLGPKKRATLRDLVTVAAATQAEERVTANENGTVEKKGSADDNGSVDQNASVDDNGTVNQSATVKEQGSVDRNATADEKGSVEE